MSIRVVGDRITGFAYAAFSESLACFSFLALSSENSGRPSTTHSGSINLRASKLRVVFSHTPGSELTRYVRQLYLAYVTVK